MFHPVADGGLDGTMIRRGGDDAHAGILEDDAGRDLHDFDLGLPGEVGVVREPVLDVGPEHREHRVDDFLGAGWPVHAQRRGLEAHDPVRRDDVVQVVDVVAVQVRQQHGIQHARHGVRGREPHDHAATGIEQQVLPARTHERGRAGARRVGNRVAGAEQDDVDSGVPTRYASRNATGRSAPQWAGAS